MDEILCIKVSWWVFFESGFKISEGKQLILSVYAVYQELH